MRISASQTAASTDVEHVHGVARQESDVGVRSEDVGDVLGGFNLSHGDHTWAELAYCIRYKLGSFCLTLCFDDSCFHFFFTHHDNVLGLLCFLLSDLLGFNRFHEVLSKLKISD